MQTLRKKRTLKDIQYFYRPEQIYELITRKTWPYKTDVDYYTKRDRALMALLFLLACRVNEVLRLRKMQFDFESDPDFIIIRSFYVSKRKEKTIKKYGPKFIDVPIPKREEARLYPFTKLVLDYLPLVGAKDDKLFKMGTRRARQIVTYVTGMWPHWFRSMALSFYVNTLRNVMVVSEMLGVEDIKTLKWYWRGAWEDYRQQLIR